jgi:hypothetical protein
MMKELDKVAVCVKKRNRIDPKKGERHLDSYAGEDLARE